MKGKITVADVAKYFYKSPRWVRRGIIEGWLPIGIATRKGKQITSVKEIDSKLGRINYYIYPEKFHKFCEPLSEIDFSSMYPGLEKHTKMQIVKYMGINKED